MQKAQTTHDAQNSTVNRSVCSRCQPGSGCKTRKAHTEAPLPLVFQTSGSAAKSKWNANPLNKHSTNHAPPFQPRCQRMQLKPAVDLFMHLLALGVRRCIKWSTASCLHAVQCDICQYAQSTQLQQALVAASVCDQSVLRHTEYNFPNITQQTHWVLSKQQLF